MRKIYLTYDNKIYTKKYGGLFLKSFNLLS